MVIDIFFLLMAAFGFYFGYTFGLMQVVLMVLSLSAAILAAMGLTPMTSELISETFEVESPFLPFLAFLVTLFIVLMMARMVSKLLEETVEGKRFDTMSQIIGGVVMGLVFTLLYSVLVTFFGRANVLDLVFNKDAFTHKKDKNIQLINVHPFDLEASSLAMISDDDMLSIFKGGKVSFGVDEFKGSYTPYFKSKKSSFSMLRGDTFVFSAKYELQVRANEELLCFCDSSLIIYAEGDTINFHCQDKNLASKSMTSFFHKYIEVIPRRGKILLQHMLPFVKDFMKYMDVALQRIENMQVRPPKPINVMSTDDEKGTDGQLEEEDVFDNVEVEVSDDDLPEADSVFVPIDTPTVAPSPSDTTPTKEEQDVEYEG